jgi:putative holliday junction resolvase
MLIDSPKEFSAKLPTHSRLLGLDVGEKTIGLALSDVMRTIASPHSTIARKKFTTDMQELKKVINEHSVCGLIIGNPINMDGSQGPRTQSIRTFVLNMHKQIDLPMLMWDERMSSMAVERTMLAADLSRQRRDQLIDKLAASYILQGLLDMIR